VPHLKNSGKSSRLSEQMIEKRGESEPILFGFIESIPDRSYSVIRRRSRRRKWLPMTSKSNAICKGFLPAELARGVQVLAGCPKFILSGFCLADAVGRL
jgi:hypothetical protein